jgi:hypothetical protein
MIQYNNKWKNERVKFTQLYKTGKSFRILFLRRHTQRADQNSKMLQHKSSFPILQ